MNGYGTSGLKDAPVTPQTPFFIGSLSKGFTALAIRQLANEGKIDYDGPVRPAGVLEEYSNLNFLILGLVVEKVSGIPYDQYMQQNIFDKLDMKHSFVSEQDAESSSPATGHTVM